MPMPAFDRLPPDKQDAIIDSAIAEFSENPYEKVSIFLIAKRAGMSRSGFYYYFSGKEDVYRCLLLRLLREFVETLPPAIDLFLYGHTHLPHITAAADNRPAVCNCGSPTFPKGGNPPTFATLDDGILRLRHLDGNIIEEKALW